jgi:hypothetical protein
MAQMNVGKIDERGFLNGMDRRGFTPSKAILELVANTLDSFDAVNTKNERTLLFDVKQRTIRIIDNAGGMNEDDISRAFNMFSENHISDRSRGVSGMGGKHAMHVLSNQKNMQLFTRKEDGSFLRVEIPWEKIHSEGIYTNQICTNEMLDAEKELFMNERYSNGMCHGHNVSGTTIEFQSTNELVELIQNFFKPINDSSFENPMNPMDRLDIVFGRENIIFKLKHFENPVIKTLSKYNYFAANNTEFYTGISTHSIEHWIRGNENRFLLLQEDRKYEIQKAGKGWSKIATPYIENTTGYTLVGVYIVRVGLRSHTTYFNSESPKFPAVSTELYGIDEEFLDKANFDFIFQNKLYRNNMLIGLIPTPDIGYGSARGSAEGHLEYYRIQLDISFNPVSTQNNPMDKFLKIQENKNQFNGNDLHLRFTRLLKYIRHLKYEEILNFFTTTIERYTTAAVQPSEEEKGDSLLDSDSETDDDSIDSQPVPQPPAPAPAPTPEPAPAPLPESEPAPAPAPAPAPERNNQVTLNLGSLSFQQYLEFLGRMTCLCDEYNVAF